MANVRMGSQFSTLYFLTGYTTMTTRRCLILFGCLLAILCSTNVVRSQPAESERFEEFYPGLQQTWIGVTRQGTPIVAGVTDDDYNYMTEKFRILVVGGLDGSIGANAAGQNASTWFRSVGNDKMYHERFALSVIPSANPNSVDWKPANGVNGNPSRGYPPKSNAYNSPTDPEAAYLWRWIGMHAPDLIVVAYGGEQLGWSVPTTDDPQLNRLGKALGAASLNETSDRLEQALVNHAPCNIGTIPAIGVTVTSKDKTFLGELMRKLDEVKFRGQSPARRELQHRLNRATVQVASQLSRYYGFDLKQVAYIPAVALIGRLKFGDLIDHDIQLNEVKDVVSLYYSGQRPTTPKSGSHLSGHLIFTELAKRTKGDDRARYVELAKHAADLAWDENGKPLPSMPFHSEMSDAVFMGGPILASVGKLTGEKKYFDACLRHIEFMRELLDADQGIYRHSPLDKAPWGRGNGFPALGLAMILTDFPEDHPGREKLLRAYKLQLNALAKYQDPNGCWHQVIDAPWSYRELSCTCMITFAMIRGIRKGWLDKEKFKPIVEKAWYAIKTRVAPNGELVDVCTGTGKQKNLRAYYDRTAILGKDPRGGAMAFLVATEMAEWYVERGDLSIGKKSQSN